jgi:hypothetical protein
MTARPLPSGSVHGAVEPHTPTLFGIADLGEVVAAARGQLSCGTGGLELGLDAIADRLVGVEQRRRIGRSADRGDLQVLGAVPIAVERRTSRRRAVAPLMPASPEKVVCLGAVVWRLPKVTRSWIAGPR